MKKELTSEEISDLIAKVEALKDAYRHANVERENAYSEAIDDAINVITRCMM